jgi:predicted enzyme related to lactoylglutathione lyase
VLKDVMEVSEVGRFAVLQDPQGAAFTAYTPASPTVPTYPTPLGGFSWHELATTDWQAALDFYRTVFGWKQSQAMDMGPMGVYLIFELNGTMLGGMFNKPPEIPVPNWLPYVRVEDAHAAAAAATAAGGRVLVGPSEVPGGDWIVQVLDPQGAAFAVHAVTAKPAESAPTAKQPAKRTSGTKGKAKTTPTKPKAAAAKPVKKAVKKPVKKTKKAGKKATARRGAKTAARKPAKSKPASRKKTPKRTAKSSKRGAGRRSNRR